MRNGQQHGGVETGLVPEMQLISLYTPFPFEVRTQSAGHGVRVRRATGVGGGGGPLAGRRPRPLRLRDLLAAVLGRKCQFSLH